MTAVSLSAACPDNRELERDLVPQRNACRFHDAGVHRQKHVAFRGERLKPSPVRLRAVLVQVDHSAPWSTFDYIELGFPNSDPLSLPLLLGKRFRGPDHDIHSQSSWVRIQGPTGRHTSPAWQCRSGTLHPCPDVELLALATP